MAQETQTGALYQLGGVGWGGTRQEVQGGGGLYVYLWLILAEV